MRDELHITVATIPNPDARDAVIEHELRLVKAALLYGDRVCLQSATIRVLNITSLALSWTKPEKAEELLATVTQAADSDHDDILALLLNEVSSASETAKLSGTLELEKVQANQRQLEIFGYMVQQTEYAQLRDPMKLGILEIPEFEATSFDGLRKEYQKRITEALGSASTYAMLDDIAGQVAEVTLRDARGKQLDPVRRERVTQASLAAWLLAELPLFDEAPMNEILDIRNELKNERLRFRSAVSGYADEIHSLPWEPDFNLEADRIYRKSVLPAVTDISESVKSNSALTHFVKNVYAAPGVIGGLLGLAVGLNTDVPAIVGAATGIGSAAVKTYFDYKQEQAVTQRNALYFFYRTKERLAKAK